jgi:hypothetical protein
VEFALGVACGLAMMVKLNECEWRNVFQHVVDCRT